jgi:hypothetical protein
MNSILLLFAASVPVAQEVQFSDVVVAEDNERIAFAHVLAEGPEPQLSVFSESMRLWPQRDENSRLATSERYVLSSGYRALGVVFHFYPCLEGTGFSRIASWTELRLPYGVPNVSPFLPPLPPPPDPIRVDNAAWVRMSDNGNLVAFIDAGHHLDEPGQVQLFRREPSSSEFRPAGDYEYTRGGDFQVSADGSVIAHADGAELRLIGASGVPERLPLEGPFFLDPSGQWLARWTKEGLKLDRLVEDLEARAEQPLEVTQVPVATVFAQDHVLVVTRSRASLFSLAEHRPKWSRESSSDSFSSGDLKDLGNGSLLIAVGELLVQSPPMRGASAGAHVHARVFELSINEPQIDELRAQTEFDVTDWLADHPDLRLIGDPPRLLVVTAKQVKLSDHIR